VTDSVYSGDDLVSADEGTMGRIGVGWGRVVEGELVDPTYDGVGRGQIGSIRVTPPTSPL
jgi:hypothetical protein